MSAAQQSGEQARHYGSPATWGDVEHARQSTEVRIAGVETQVAQLETRQETRIAGVETQMAEMETRLERKIGDLRTEMTAMEGRLERQMAGVETRLIRWSAGLAVAGGVAVIGFLVGILQAVD